MPTFTPYIPDPQGPNLFGRPNSGPRGRKPADPVYVAVLKEATKESKQAAPFTTAEERKTIVRNLRRAAEELDGSVHMRIDGTETAGRVVFYLGTKIRKPRAAKVAPATAEPASPATVEPAPEPPTASLKTPRRTRSTHR